MNHASEPIDAATIRTALQQARESARQIGDLQAANARTIRSLETALNQAIKDPLQDPLNTPSSAPRLIKEHRRAHRPGYPSRFASDPELAAFIRARIDRMPFAEIIADTAANFPPKRRTCMSALSQRWNSNRQLSPDRS